MDFPPFPGFRDEAFEFLRNLSENNDREWFKPHKTTFDDEIQWPFKCLLADTAREFAHRDIPLTADPKRSLYRIYRDTRFSKNKDPYKTHLGAVLSPDGKRDTPGGLYIHFQPGASFLAAGYWNPESRLLRSWRTRMSDDPAAFLGLAERLDERGLPLKPRSDVLKRMPRGFEGLADTDIAPYLRWKSFIVSRPVDDDALQTPDFTHEVVAFARDVLPLLAYGWELEESVA
jgi:uncharacterized protein (TIGR02453 family)